MSDSSRQEAAASFVPYAHALIAETASPAAAIESSSIAMPAAPPPVATEGGPEVADMPPTAGKHNAIDSSTTQTSTKTKEASTGGPVEGTAEGPADITQKDDMEPPPRYLTALPGTASDVQSEQDPIWLQQSA